jgi:hypothetical protein
MGNSKNESLTTEYQAVYLDHEIFIEPNRDQYRGGFEWSVCRDGIELNVGLDFTFEVALQQARIFVDSIVQK